MDLQMVCTWRVEATGINKLRNHLLGTSTQVRACTASSQAFLVVRDKLLGVQQQQLAAAATASNLRAAAAAAAVGATGPTPAGRPQGGLIQTSMHIGLQRMNREEVDDKVAAFFYANGIAFYASRSLEFVQRDGGCHSAAYTAPKYDALRTTLLDRAGARCKSQGLAFLAKEIKGGFTIRHTIHVLIY